MSVRDVADGFGAERGYARTTIQTLMERLRAKNYVTRKRLDGGFVYTSRFSQPDLMRSVIGRFVTRALGGSVSPLVAYLVEKGDLSDEEVARLRALVGQLEEERDDA